MGFKELLDAIDDDPSIRSRLLYFPGQLAETYQIDEKHLELIRDGKLAEVPMDDDLRERAVRRLATYGI